MIKKLTNFFKDEEGAGMVEYGLLVALIAMGLLVALQGVRDGLIALFGRVVAAL